MTERARRIVNQVIDSLSDGRHIENNPIEPDHYKTGSVECIDAMEAALSPDGFQGYLAGNVIKYVWRYRNKNGTEDLKKARWYLERLISSREEGTSESSGPNQ